MKDRKHWLYASLALIGGIFGGAVSGHLFPSVGVADAAARGAREMRAEKFVLVDRRGNERGTIEVTTRGFAQISLEDNDGRARGQFRVGGDGDSTLGFYDQNGAKRVVLGMSPTERDGLALYAANGRQIAGFSVTEDSQASIALYDPASGRARVGLGVATTGEPALGLFDKEGHDRAELHVNDQGKPGLSLADETGKSIAGLPMQQPAPIPYEK
jgi:hypothetical protein